MNDQTPPPSPAFELQPSRFERLRGRLRSPHLGRPHVGRPHLRRPGRRALGPGMALYLLSPLIAEMCSGATPWYSYIFFGWMLCLMYGGGAILIRETTLRWGKGWPTILALGVAYAIAEEGIAVRTFFDPAGAAKGLGPYGWLGGVNWVWVTEMALYHAIISIAIPIFLVMLAYPARRNEPWVSARWLKKATIGYVGVIAFWLVFYKLPVQGIYIIACLAAIAALVRLARRLPASIQIAPGSGAAPTPRRVVLACFGAAAGVFVLSFTRGLGLSPLDGVLGMIALAAVPGWWLMRSSARPGWTDRHRYAVAAGVLFSLVALSPIMELVGQHGQVVVGIVFAWLMRRTWRRLRARETVAETAPVSLEGSPEAA